MPVNGNNTPARTNFRPPWLKESAPAAAAPSNKPAWARRTPAENKAENSKSEAASVTKAVEVTPATTSSPAKKTTAITVIPKENGQTKPSPSAATAKLQSREIKVPIMTEKSKPAPLPLKKAEPKEREINLVVERETGKPKPKVGATTPVKKPPVQVEKEEEEDEEEEEEEEESEYETETETETEESEEDEDEEEEEPVVEAPKPPSPKPKILVPLKKVVTKSPEKPANTKDTKSSERSSSPEPKLFTKPTLKKVAVPPEKKIPDRSTSPEPKFVRPQLRKVPSSLKVPRKREKIPEVQLKRPPKDQVDEVKDKEKPFPLKPSMLKSESSARIPPPPPPPAGPMPPPPPPPPPGLKPPSDFEKKPISSKQQKILEKLKTRPRRRPDWSEMMKEVEDGRKLRHVECNDRSQPIITCKSMAKVQGQFIYETEKATVHNKLLKQIQGGICLKPTKCNDRSRPLLDGLRKFRRQMTIEEQILKSESRANLAEMKPVESEEDEMDDIDKVRDDLQSTKQLLALELRNREAQERENKRLQTRLQNLEAELERVLWQPCAPETTEDVPDDLVTSLRKEAVEAQNNAKILEQKYHDIAVELDATKIELEEKKRLLAAMNKRHSVQGSTSMVDSRRMVEPPSKDSSPEPEIEESEEEEEEEDEEKKAEKAAKKLNREVKMLHAKLDRLKEKQEAAQKERKSLREAMKKNQLVLKGERKTFKKLQREVEKMAALMKDDGGDDDEEKEEPEEEPEEEEEESEEEETETEESESETETESESENEDASDIRKKSNLEPRVKRHDGRLASLKKGNYLLQANVDRLQDEIVHQREASAQLKSDLDSVISDLG